MANESRKSTRKLLDLLEQGVLDKDMVILACVNYMSEHEVDDMCSRNEFFGDDGDPDGEDEEMEVVGYEPDMVLSERRFAEIKAMLDEDPDNADQLSLEEYETFMEMEERRER